MIDLVTANEFTFTPSAFIAAYIEQETSTSVTETTTNGGTLSTTPSRNVETISSTYSVNALSGTHTGLPLTIQTEGTIQTPGPGESFTPTLIPGGSGSTAGYTISGSLQDIVGEVVSDTRTVSKTTTTSSGVLQTVVLVLSYGQFRSKCVNAQATVTLIHDRVAAYLNSLV